ncbi:MAG: DUF99 family protein [Holophagales bacterium]|nr:DUF99 family protein [Holophagales bacterium]
MALSHVVGFDDAPFPRAFRGDVPVVGCVFSEATFTGVLSGRVRKDGRNATDVLARLVRESKWAPQLYLVMLQGIALAGFNVVDLASLRSLTGLPVLVVARRLPDLGAIRDALLGRVAGGARKWALVEAAGPMEPCAGVFVQRAGLDLAEAAEVVHRTALHGNIPEPLRAAHLVAGGAFGGESRGRA